jgi:phage tail-like protein
MATGSRPKDPTRGYHFRIEIQGVTRAAFREASGLDTSQDPIEYREGNDPIHSRKLPGLVKHSNIVLKWGHSDDHDLFDWRDQVANGKIERKNISIIQLDEEGNDSARWNLSEAWPAKWVGPSYNATSNEVAIETVEFAVEELKKG